VRGDCPWTATLRAGACRLVAGGPGPWRRELASLFPVLDHVGTIVFATSQRRVLLFAAITLVADWGTKVIAVTQWHDTPLDLGWVVLRDRRNPGIAFSLGDNLPVGVILAVTGVVVVFFVVMAFRGLLVPPSGAGLIVGGGLGNLVDRAVNGAVVDMIDLGWWPTFNIADAALNVGVGIVLVYSFLVDPDADGTDADSTAAAEADAS
jgi:signal peptidase II